MVAYGWVTSDNRSELNPAGDDGFGMVAEFDFNICPAAPHSTQHHSHHPRRSPTFASEVVIGSAD